AGDQLALDRIDHALTESSGLLRDTVTQLHPAVLRQAGLSRALRDLGASTAARGNLQVTVEAGQWPDGPTELDLLLFGCARELLANVAKHAKATSVWISLSRQRGRAELEICDDGVGLDESVRAARLADGHVGLASLQTRVLAAAGELVIGGRTPEGTTVRVTVPVP
ncbi:MAG TPA: ATP-binding protein, partial [Rhodopila sp.]